MFDLIFILIFTEPPSPKRSAGPRPLCHGPGLPSDGPFLPPPLGLFAWRIDASMRGDGGPFWRKVQNSECTKDATPTLKLNDIRHRLV